MTQSPAPLTPEQIAMLERDVDETILKGSPEARGMALALQLFIKPLLSTISTLQAELENLRARPTADHVYHKSSCQLLCEALFIGDPKATADSRLHAMYALEMDGHIEKTDTTPVPLTDEELEK